MRKEEILEIVNGESYKPKTKKQWLAEIEKSKQAEEEQILEDMLASYELAYDAKKRLVYARSQGYVRGKLTVHQKGFGFCENDDESVYIGKSEMNGAIQDDEVVVLIEKNDDGTEAGNVVKVISHGLKYIVGSIRRKGEKSIFFADQQNFQQKIRVQKLKELNLADNTKVRLEIVEYGDPMICQIDMVIGNKYDPGVDISSLLIELGIRMEFPKAVMEEAKKKPQRVLENEMKGRRDLRGQQIITIDGDDSRDLDDAISLEVNDRGYKLGVHIADVSHYVDEKSSIDVEAFERGTSVYVVDRVVPMLPQLLSNGICSLNPKEDRLTLSCVMQFDFEGIVQSYEVFPSIIRTTERMTYNNVNKILANDKKAKEKYEHIVEMIHHCDLLSRKISKQKHKHGAIDFDTKETKIVVNKKGKPIDIKIIERGRSERMIEDFMVSANESVAAFMTEKDVPSIYRIHESPDETKIQDFSKAVRILGYKFSGGTKKVLPKQFQSLLEEAKGDENYDVLAMNMLRSMQKAHYDPRPIGHFGLALEDYLHFTSPIRRYPDLIVHRMLRKYVFEKQSVRKSDIVFVEEAAKQASIKERKAVDAERAVNDMKKAEYMEQYIGREYVGKITSVTKFGLFVELDNTIEGLVHMSNMKDDFYRYDEETRQMIGTRGGKTYKMGQVVKVKCLDADRFKRQIDFVLLEKKIKKQKKRTPRRKRYAKH